MLPGIVVQHLVIMGGNEAYNQCTSTGAEFNFFCDPDAADMVIRKVRVTQQQRRKLHSPTQAVTCQISHAHCAHAIASCAMIQPSRLSELVLLLTA